MKRISEVANIDMSLLIRDENLELMDQYLTNGTARAIQSLFSLIKMEMNKLFGDHALKSTRISNFNARYIT